MASRAGDIDANGALVERMGAALCALDAARLDAPLIAKTKLCLLDFFASAFAAAELPWSRQAAAAVAPCVPSAVPGAAGEATIVGSPWRATPGDAAFANAVRGHGLVRDDMHLGSVSHLGVVVIPPALALAETSQRPVSGRELIAAIVAGYEAGGKLGRAILDVEVARIFRPTGITGPFAGAAAASRLLASDAATTAAALALAANAAAGYNEWAATGGSEMFFQTGSAARSGVLAARLAAAGAIASSTALDGPAGILAAFGKRGRAAPALPFAGSAEILDVFFKEVPACNFAQAAAQAARDLAVRESLAPDAIDRIVVRVPFAAREYPGCNWAGPFATVLKAKMSIHYNVAAALATGAFDEASYEPERQPAIVALAKRVAIEVDDALTSAFPRRQGAAVTAFDLRGRAYASAVDDVAPAADTLVRARCEAAAGAALGDAGARALVAAIDALEGTEDARGLAGLAATAAGGRS